MRKTDPRNSVMTHAWMDIPDRVATIQASVSFLFENVKKSEDCSALLVCQ
jgi:hypothetical protein